MGDDWDFDFLPPGLGYADLDPKQQTLPEPDQVRACRACKRGRGTALGRSLATDACLTPLRASVL